MGDGDRSKGEGEIVKRRFLIEEDWHGSEGVLFVFVLDLFF